MASTLTVDTIVGATAASKVKLPAGAILQTVNYVNNTNHVKSGTSYTGTNLQATITPKYVDSKILILVATGVDTNTGGRGANITVYRDNTTNLAINNSSNYMGYGIGYGGRLQVSTNIMFLDSPATTNATNYRIYLRSTDSGQVESPGTYQNQTITLLEIAQ